MTTTPFDSDFRVSFSSTTQSDLTDPIEAGFEITLVAEVSINHGPGATDLVMQHNMAHLHFIQLFGAAESSSGTADNECVLGTKREDVVDPVVVPSGSVVFCLPTYANGTSWRIKYQVVVADTMPIGFPWTEQFQFSYYCESGGGVRKLYSAASELMLFGRKPDLSLTISKEDSTNYAGVPYASTAGDEIVMETLITMPRGRIVGAVIDVTLDSGSNCIFAEDTNTAIKSPLNQGVTSEYQSWLGPGIYESAEQRHPLGELVRPGGNGGDGTGILIVYFKVAVFDGADNGTAFSVNVRLRYTYNSSADIDAASYGVNQIKVKIETLFIVPTLEHQISIVNLNDTNGGSLQLAGDAGDIFQLTHTLVALPVATINALVINTTLSEHLEFLPDSWIFVDPAGMQPSSIYAAVGGRVLQLPRLAGGTTATIVELVKLRATTAGFSDSTVGVTIAYSSAPVPAGRSNISATGRDITSIKRSNTQSLSPIPPTAQSSVGNHQRLGNVAVGERFGFNFTIRLPEGTFVPLVIKFQLRGLGIADSPVRIEGGRLIATGSNVQIGSTGAGSIRSRRSLIAKDLREDKVTNIPDNIDDEKDDLTVELLLSVPNYSWISTGGGAVLTGVLEAGEPPIVVPFVSQTFKVVQPIIEAIISVRLFADQQHSNAPIRVDFGIRVQHTNESALVAAEVTVRFSFNSTAFAWINSSDLVALDLSERGRYVEAITAPTIAELELGDDAVSSTVLSLDQSDVREGDSLCGTVSLQWSQSGGGRRYASSHDACYVHVSESSSESNALKMWQLVLIALGLLLVIAALVACAVFTIRRRARNRDKTMMIRSVQLTGPSSSSLHGFIYDPYGLPADHPQRWSDEPAVDEYGTVGAPVAFSVSGGDEDYNNIGGILTMHAKGQEVDLEQENGDEYMNSSAVHVPWSREPAFDPTEYGLVATDGPLLADAGIVARQIAARASQRAAQSSKRASAMALSALPAGPARPILASTHFADPVIDEDWVAEGVASRAVAAGIDAVLGRDPEVIHSTSKPNASHEFNRKTTDWTLETLIASSAVPQPNFRGDAATALAEAVEGWDNTESVSGVGDIDMNRSSIRTSSSRSATTSFVNEVNINTIHEVSHLEDMEGFRAVTLDGRAVQWGTSNDMYERERSRRTSLASSIASGNDTVFGLSPLPNAGLAVGAADDYDSSDDDGWAKPSSVRLGGVGPAPAWHSSYLGSAGSREPRGGADGGSVASSPLISRVPEPARFDATNELSVARRGRPVLESGPAFASLNESPGFDLGDDDIAAMAARERFKAVSHAVRSTRRLAGGSAKTTLGTTEQVGPVSPKPQRTASLPTSTRPPQIALYSSPGTGGGSSKDPWQIFDQTDFAQTGPVWAS